MIIMLRVSEGLIVEAKYSTYGCPAAKACGEYVTGSAEGQRVFDAGDIDEAAVLREVGAMPLGREHCPRLAVNALRDAMSKCIIAEREV